jgi:hypothetical protein
LANCTGVSINVAAGLFAAMLGPMTPTTISAFPSATTMQG